MPASISKVLATAIRIPWAVVGLIFLTLPAAYAQVASEGKIVGHVRGPGDVSVPGATVQIIEPKTGERKATWTDEAGDYTLTGLKPGTYRLEVALVGFRTDLREPVPVAAGKTLKVNIALRIALPEAPASAARKPLPPGRPDDLKAFGEEMRARLGNLGMEANPMAGASGGAEGNIRFSEGSSGLSMPQGESSGVESDPTSSAANSFLLSGSVNRGGPGDDEVRFRERVEEFRHRYQPMPGAPGFGGSPGGGEPFMIFLGGPRGGGAGGRA